jgi:hypothetical protein
MHETIVEYCHCLQAPSEPFQLIEVGLFPSTLDQPMTAFTFEVLQNLKSMPLPPKNPPMITVMPSGNLQTVPSPKVFP